MFDLEKSITEWRCAMLAAGIKSPAPLDELEGHLREDIRILVSGGTLEPEAFQLAVSRLGTPGSVSVEFKKANNPRSLPVMIGFSLWVCALLPLAILLSERSSAGKLNLLLSAHIFTLTAGYLAAFLTGGLGFAYACFRLCHQLSPSRRQSLERAVVLFTRISTALVAAGVLLGLLWSKQNRGAFFTADPREIATLCVLAWFLAALFVQRFARVGGRVGMLLAIARSLFVGLAWLGALIAANVRGRENGIHWHLAMFIGIHLVFLALIAVPAGSIRLKSS